MKLTDQQIADARDTLGVSPLPEDHPVMDQLQQAFGEHTFYLHQEGLSVFADQGEMQIPDGDPRLVLLAAWTNEDKTELGAVEPVISDHTLPSGAPDEAG